MYHSGLSSTIKISEGLFYPYVTKSMAFVQTEVTVHYEGLICPTSQRSWIFWKFNST